MAVSETDGRSGAEAGTGAGAETGDEAKLTIMQRFFGLSSTATERELTAGEINEVNGFVAAQPTLDRLLGVRYRSVGPQKIVVELEIMADHLQPWGITNGGVYSALGETAGSMASFVAAGAEPVVMGTSNETHFLRPSSAGDVIVSTATPENLGRTSHLWRIEHRNEKIGKLCALTFLKTHVVR